MVAQPKLPHGVAPHHVHTPSVVTSQQRVKPPVNQPYSELHHVSLQQGSGSGQSHLSSRSAWTLLSSSISCTYDCSCSTSCSSDSCRESQSSARYAVGQPMIALTQACIFRLMLRHLEPIDELGLGPLDRQLAGCQVGLELITAEVLELLP